MTPTPDILILASVTGIEAIKHDLERCQNNLISAESVIDLLESNARVQAKLLADTGRELEAVKGHAPRMLTVQALTEVLVFLNKIEGDGYGGMSAFEIVRDHVRTALECDDTTPRLPDIEALCRDYAARWLGKDWALMDDDDEAELRIEAHRWLKCWEAVTSTERSPVGEK